MWEESWNWERAIDNYLELSEDHFERGFLLEVWDRVARVAKDHLPHKHTEIIRILCKRLRESDQLERAGELYEEIGHFEEATKCFLREGLFERAKLNLGKVNDVET